METQVSLSGPLLGLFILHSSSESLMKQKSVISQLKHNYTEKSGGKRIQTFELNGASDQCLALVLRLQVSGLTSDATTATARVGVTVLADQHLALKIHRLASSQKLEGSKTEAGVVFEARCVDSISAVCSASKGETEVVTSCCRQKGPSKRSKRP